MAEWLLPTIREALGVQPESELLNRRLLQEDQGRVSIPFLYDPNTEEGLFESATIIAYLNDHYAL